MTKEMLHPAMLDGKSRLTFKVTETPFCGRSRSCTRPGSPPSGKVTVESPWIPATSGSGGVCGVSLELGRRSRRWQELESRLQQVAIMDIDGRALALLGHPASTRGSIMLCRGRLQPESDERFPRL
jgi:hypothetical protein